APTIPPSPIAQPSSPPQQQQPSQPTIISMDLLNNLLETYADKDVTLEEVGVEKKVEVEKNAEIEKNADVQGSPEESQAKVYHIDLEHADKVLSMQDDVKEPAELQEVVTTAKLMTAVV
nr:hypothetical protein [Tanacetum cinerariifolium]